MIQNKTGAYYLLRINVFTAKEAIIKIKRQPTEWEKYSLVHLISG